MGKFRQMTLELWPLIEVKNCLIEVKNFINMEAETWYFKMSVGIYWF